MKKLVAHRGFRTIHGENRMIDFISALNICKAVEFDIRMTKDQKIIIFHDHNFKRIGNVDNTVRNFTYDEIKELKFFKDNPDFLPPLFIEDFIDKIACQYEMINVEIKPDRYTEYEHNLILVALEKLSQATDAEIIVSSFGPNDLEFISNLPQKFKRGYLVEGFGSIDFELIKKFDYFHPYVGSLKRKESKAICERINLPLNVWTFENNEDAYRINKEYGELIHSFISDKPDLNWYTNSEE